MRSSTLKIQKLRIVTNTMFATGIFAATEPEMNLPKNWDLIADVTFAVTIAAVQNARPDTASAAGTAF